MKTGVAEEDLENTFSRRVFPENGIDLLSNGPEHGILPAFLDDAHRERLQQVYGWLRAAGLSSRAAREYQCRAGSPVRAPAPRLATLRNLLDTLSHFAVKCRISPVR